MKLEIDIPDYEDNLETWSYVLGYMDGILNFPMSDLISTYPNAYSKGYWEGKAANETISSRN